MSHLTLPPIWNGDQGDVPEKWQDLLSLSMAILALFVVIHRASSLANRRSVSINGGEEPLTYRGLTEPVNSAFQTCQLFASMLLMVLSIAVLISQPLIAGVEYVNWEWIGAGSAVAAWTFSSLIVYHESRYDLTAGRLLRLWWVLLLIPASIRLRTDILALRSDGPESDWTMKESARIVRIVSFLPQIFLSFAGIIANDSDLAKGYQPLEGYPMQEDPGEGPSTYEDAGGCWTTYTFSWMTPLLREGTQTAIERNQLYRLQTEDCTAVNYSKLSAAWGCRVA